MNTTQTNWYESLENLRQLAAAIQDRDGATALDTAEFLEKPWKWSPEWNYLQTHDNLEEFKDD